MQRCLQGSVQDNIFNDGQYIENIIYLVLFRSIRLWQDNVDTLNTTFWINVSISIECVFNLSKVPLTCK